MDTKGGYSEYDAIVVGGSVVGCTAATLLAQSGVRVALVEKHDDLDAYRKVCTHFLQPCGLEVVERMGFLAALRRSGAIANPLEVWTRWGWIRAPRDSVCAGYNIRRKTLDGQLRRHAVAQPGVSYFAGWEAKALLVQHRSFDGVELVSSTGDTMSLRARLVVGADGRNSAVAKLAGIPAAVRPNGRFTFFRYYRGLRLRGGVPAQYWHHDPELAYAFVNDNEHTLLGIFLPAEALASFREAPEDNFRRFWAEMPDGPDLSAAHPVGDLRGMVHMPNLVRSRSGRGVALVGDAAVALDPIWGTGIAFGMLGAARLCDAVAPVLRANASASDVHRAIRAYWRTHWGKIRGHAAHIQHFSKVRPVSWPERLMFAAASRDEVLAVELLRYLGREQGPLSLLRPRYIVRALRMAKRAPVIAALSPAAGSREGHV